MKRSRKYKRSRLVARPSRELTKKNKKLTVVTRKQRPIKAIRLLPPVKRAKKIGKIVVTQQIIPRKPRVLRGSLRLELTPSGCRRRKQYKKTMLKSLAAQAAGSGNLQSWRNKRKINTNIVYRC